MIVVADYGPAPTGHKRFIKFWLSFSLSFFPFNVKPHLKLIEFSSEIKLITSKLKI